MEHEIRVRHRKGGRVYDDVVLQRNRGRNGMWVVLDELFVEKGGMSMDFFDRVVAEKGGGGLKVVMLNNGRRGRLARYVVVDWRAKRLLEYCGNSICEGWCVLEGGNEPSYDLRELARYGVRVKGFMDKGSEFFSKEEIARVVGIGEPTLAKLVRIGVLTTRKMRVKDYSAGAWTARNKTFICADEYLELVLLEYGVICTGMSYEDWKALMRIVGSAIRDCRKTALHRYRTMVKRKKGIVKKRLSKTYNDVYIASAKHYYDRGVKEILSNYR